MTAQDPSCNPPINQSLSNNPKFCPNCGVSFPAAAEFCSRCGARIGTEVIKTPSQTRQKVPYQSAPYQTTYYSPGPYFTIPTNVKGSVGLILAIFGIFCIFLSPFLMLPLGVIATVLGGVGRSRDLTKGLATAAIYVGAIVFIIGIYASILLWPLMA